LLLDLEQLGIELVDQHLAGQADPWSSSAISQSALSE
jgi:hypothetical protein